MRAALLFFHLRNHRTYGQLIRETDAEIARLDAAHAAARGAGDSDAAIRLLYEADDARASREALAATYLELTGRPTGPDDAGNLHPGSPGDVAQPAQPGRPGIPPDP